MRNSYSLPVEVSIYSVAELRAQWLGWLGDTPDSGRIADELCCVEAAAVDEVDAAGVQLLLSLSNALAQRHRSLLLANPSQALAKACAALGASSLLAHADSHGAKA